MQDVKVTGGGAYKFQDLIREKLGLQTDKCDEMGCIVQVGAPSSLLVRGYLMVVVLDVTGLQLSPEKHI